MRPKLDLGYVLELVSEPAFIKIGRTSDLVGRLQSFRLHCPFQVRLIAIIARGADAERTLKAEMSEFWHSSEWYRPNLVLERVLREWRAEGRLLHRVQVDNAYIEAHIIPAVLNVLAGRQPLNNDGGDLVQRLIDGKLPTIKGREKDLMESVAEKTFTYETLFGYASLGPDSGNVELLPTPVRRSYTRRTAA